MKKKRILTLLLAMVLMVGSLSTTVSAAPTQAEIDAQIQATAKYLAKEYDGDISVDKYFYVFLIVSSGIECNSIINQYKDAVINNISNNAGKLKSSGFEKPEVYGSVIMTLKACGIDPRSIGGTNLISDMSSFLSTYNFGTYNGTMYELVYLMSVLQYYKNDITNSDIYIESVKDAILNFYCAEQYVGNTWVQDPVTKAWSQISTVVPGTGFYYYGFASDNDAKMISILKPFYNTDSEVKAIIDTLIPKIVGTIDENNQVDGYGYGPNSDSTGLVLSALSIYNNSKSTDLYSGLLDFRSQTDTGAYFYSNQVTNADPEFATRDALEGLLSYKRMLLGRPSIYDITAFDTTYVTNTVNLNLSIQNPESLPVGALLNISTVTNIPSNITTTLNKISKSYIALDLSLIKNGTYIHELQVPLQFALDIPAGYSNPAIYYIDQNGNYEKINSTISNGKITFTLTHFSTYAIVDELIAPATADSSSLFLYTILACSSLLTLAIYKKTATLIK